MLNKRKQFIMLARSSGFGIIELMIAVVMLGIVLTFAIPSYREWAENTKIRNIAESILNGLQKSRAEAVTNNAAVLFTLTGNNWTVGCVTVSDSCPALIEQYIADSSAGNITSTPDANTSVTFSALGLSSDPANSFSVIDVASSVTGTRPLRIEVGVGGSVRLCDPAFTVAESPRGCN